MIRTLSFLISLAGLFSSPAFADSFYSDDVEVSRQSAAETQVPLDPNHLNGGHRWIIQHFVSVPGVQQRLFDIKMTLMLQFHQDTGGTYELNSNTVDQVAQEATAQKRAADISKFLEKDLDNNGEVSAAEFEVYLKPLALQPLASNARVRVSPTKQQVDIIMAQLLRNALEDDANRDGVVDFAEMRASATRRNPQQLHKPCNMETIMLLDRDGNRSVSGGELATAIDSVFALVDTDKSGAVDSKEALAARTTYVSRSLPGMIRTCF
ncbi:MAG: hypothetical protein JWM58_3230 [Rhizobium sp.]|nr:hypothetical protein [Rhizobium sp.]